MKKRDQGYDEEFIVEVVEASYRDGVKKTAAYTGVPDRTIRRWRAAYGENAREIWEAEKKALAEAGKKALAEAEKKARAEAEKKALVPKLETENAALRTKVERLTAENTNLRYDIERLEKSNKSLRNAIAALADAH